MDISSILRVKNKRIGAYIFAEVLKNQMKPSLASFSLTASLMYLFLF